MHLTIIIRERIWKTESSVCGPNRAQTIYPGFSLKSIFIQIGTTNKERKMLEINISRENALNYAELCWVHSISFGPIYGHIFHWTFLAQLPKFVRSPNDKIFVLIIFGKQNCAWFFVTRTLKFKRDFLLTFMHPLDMTFNILRPGISFRFAVLWWVNKVSYN